MEWFWVEELEQQNTSLVFDKQLWRCGGEIEIRAISEEEFAELRVCNAVPEDIENVTLINDW